MMQRNTDTELALIARLKAGDSTAVDELAAAYGPKINQLALRYMKNREDAEEVAQDVLLKVFRKIHHFRGDSALSSWIYRITFNAAMSRLRNSRFSRPFEVSDDALKTPDGAERTRLPREAADWSSMADEALLRLQVRERVQKALAELPSIYRIPVVLRDIDGLSTEEASAALKVKTQTLKSRLHRGRLALRRHLSDFGSSLTLHPAA